MTIEDNELYSLLVPLSGDRLIVPRACVAEVVRFSAPEPVAGSDDWMLGNVTWNGRPLPVVSFEGTLGNDVPVATGRTRIVVFYASGGQLRPGYYGILTQGFPQLVRVNRDVLKLDDKDSWLEGAPVFCRVRMINEFPIIPNLERLEAMLAATAAEA